MLQPVESTVMSSTKKLKILFYHAEFEALEGIAWVCVATLQLKTYIDLHYPDVAKHLEWLVPIQTEVSDEDLIKHIEQTGANLLCTSHYLWTHNYLTRQLSTVKKQLKNRIKTIAGGPSIDVNTNNDFFDKHPYIDYAVYGAGEQAFADIVAHLVNDSPLIAFNTSNCAWKNNDTGKTIVADYKFVKMMETSPFVHNEELLTAMVADVNNTNTKLFLSYSLTRGCPYSCTFCDWNSGLGNKVSRRKNTYQQEIDLFQKLGIKNIYLADANVGQYTEDVEMVEYFAQKNLQENANFRLSGNYSKLKKENNLKIFHFLIQGGLISKAVNFSIQDTNKEVLKNIDRPDVGWEAHLDMANKLRDQYPGVIVKAQLIYGLPGQTPDTWRQTLQQIAQENIWPVIFINMPLSASPALYDLEYQRKFQFEYTHSNRIANEKVYSSLLPKKSSSFDQSDLVTMTLLNSIYISLITINLVLIEHGLQTLDTSCVVNDFLDTSNYQNLHNNFYYNWSVENNFYYTINFSGTKTPISDINLSSALLGDYLFLKYLKKFIPTHQQNAFAKLCMSKEFVKLHDQDLSQID